MSYQSLAGMGDYTPPEPAEEAEFKIKFESEALNYECFVTAKVLNMDINDCVNYMYKVDKHFPIYLNGTEWDGNQLDEKDMAEL